MGEERPTSASSGAPAGYFEPLAQQPHCAACNSLVPSSRLVDAVYCISLQEEPERTQRAADHFHAIGLCRHVIFYRPKRGRDIEAATWRSHRDVARHAIAQNHNAVLILEDDAQFSADWPSVSRRAVRAMAKLPQGWLAFYLGHWPVQAYFIAADVLRARSALAHAYIANRGLLDQLARWRPLDATLPTMWPGYSIDTAFANLPEMYALFPMVATQRLTDERRHDSRLTPTGARRGWFAFGRHRYWIIHHCMRPAEILAAMLSPVHWALMRLRGTGSGQSGRIETAASRNARLVFEAGLFDEAHYASDRPDVDADSIDPLTHYLEHGDTEGRSPHPLFDAGFYRRSLRKPLAPSMHAVIHYLQSPAAERGEPHPCFDTAWYVGRLADGSTGGKAPLVHYLHHDPPTRPNPHPCFDEGWYRSQSPELLASGEAGLAHYLRIGWKQARWPHPMFDPRRYLAENPDVAAAGANPFDHYLRHGRAEGRALWFDCQTAEPAPRAA